MVKIQEQALDVAALVAQQQAQYAGRAGAMVHFLGLVRDFSPEQGSQSLFLEHYPGMCERQIEAICAQAQQRWPVLGAQVVHRVGLMQLAEPIVFVGVAALHRAAAFAACEFIIDNLKTIAPFWKRETLADGASFWVQQQAQDAQRTARWHQEGAQNHAG